MNHLKVDKRLQTVAAGREESSYDQGPAAESLWWAWPKEGRKLAVAGAPFSWEKQRVSVDTPSEVSGIDCGSDGG